MLLIGLDSPIDRQSSANGFAGSPLGQMEYHIKYFGSSCDQLWCSAKIVAATILLHLCRVKNSFKHVESNMCLTFQWRKEDVIQTLESITRSNGKMLLSSFSRVPMEEAYQHVAELVIVELADEGGSAIEASDGCGDSRHWEQRPLLAVI
ncbi:hypothetical protein ACLOJK_008005 [Asimina triloba]